VGLHATLLVLEAGETIGMTIALFDEVPVRTMTDVVDDASYWYFVVLFWVPLYVIVYLLPWMRQ
jgi:heme/copper-type cytochrome/quinol oxidase subunit 3